MAGSSCAWRERTVPATLPGRDPTTDGLDSDGRKGLRRILCRPRHLAPVAAYHASSLVALSAGDVGGRGSALSMDRDESVSFWRRTGRGLLRLTRSKGARKGWEGLSNSGDARHISDASWLTHQLRHSSSQGSFSLVFTEGWFES